MALAAVVAVVLGSGELFRKPHLYICMFQGNLSGLKVGAAVKIRGVQVGTVERISLRLQAGQGELRQVNIAQAPIPVILALEEREFRAKGGTTQSFNREEFDRLVRQGLRAQLKMESLLTGLLYVGLNFQPNTPLHLYIAPGTSPYPEIPTIPTELEQIHEDATKALAKLEKVDLDALVTSITEAGVSVKQLAGDPELHQAIASLNQLVGDPDLKASVDKLDETLGNVNKAVISAKNAIDRTGARIDPLIANLEKSSTDLQEALVQARSTLASAQLLVSPSSPMTHKIDLTLEELAEASRSIHDLADYLQRNPGALIRGKYVSDSK
ncbi:MAG: MlaD family protein [Candidatus Binataceae bacterium]